MPAIAFALICWWVWFLPAQFVDLLTFDRGALLNGEWWRLWSAHFTHYTLMQMAADTGVVVVLGFVIRSRISGTFLTVCVLVAMPVISGLMLWLAPEMNSYRGASAVASLMWALGGSLFLAECRPFSARFWMGLLFLLLLAIKIVGEGLALLPPLTELPDGVRVAWQGHLFGAVAGFLIFLLWTQRVEKSL